MKTFIIFLIALIVSSSLTAQQSSRLYSESFYTFDTLSKTYFIWDTTTYQYRNGYGGDPLKLTPHLYDTAIKFYYPNLTPVLARRNFQTFSNKNNISTHTQYWDTTNKVWSVSSKVDYTYNNAGKLISEITGGKTLYFYNSNDSLIEKLSLKFNSSTGQYDSSYRERNHYTGLRLDSSAGAYFIQSWRDTFKTIYVHSLPNASYYYEFWKNGNSWDSFSRHHCIYDNNRRVIYDSLFHWYFDLPTYPLGWYFQGINRYTYNSNGQLIDFILEGGTGYYLPPFITVKSDRHVFSYNSYGQMTSAEEFNWNFNANQWQAGYGCVKYNYYYQPYTPLSLTDLAKPNEYFTCYPNPAKDKIYIKTHKSFSYSVYSATGKVQMSGFAKEGEIDISHLPSGSYLLSVANEFLGKFIKL